MNRVCDACQPVLDGAFDAVNRQVAKRAAAEGTAAYATDLALRWVELVIERRHTTDQEHAQGEAQLITDTQAFLMSAPVYATAITRATNVGEALSVGEVGGASPTPGEAY